VGQNDGYSIGRLIEESQCFICTLINLDGAFLLMFTSRAALWAVRWSLIAAADSLWVYNVAGAFRVGHLRTIDALSVRIRTRLSIIINRNDVDHHIRSDT
jgi:hypothetical protein